MAAILAFALLVGTAMPTEPLSAPNPPAYVVLAQGSGTFYAAGVFEQVLDYRLATGRVQPCADCIGQVALMDCAYIGRLVYVKWPDGTIDGRYQVCDCAQAEHRASLERRGRAAEYDFETAKRHVKLGALAGPIPVQILELVREPACSKHGASPC